MKTYKTILLISLILFLNCSLGNDTSANDVPKTNTTWHLVQTTGGIEGVNDQFELGTIVWTFYDNTGNLIIDNQNTDANKEDFLDSGTYTFSLATIEGQNFITIDGTEYGEITIGAIEFIIDENTKSTGDGADGFIYTFEKVVEEI
ncbi:hypothetical protein V8G61_05450 [Gaetbulibacter sp. M240]|uniref:hypothetical protein n=1 Tax=Gaetbulibacter sp. M240 TaxID=3126511 RepID=UPI00374E90E1